MGYALQIDTADEVPLASNSGWGDFSRWVAGLPAGFPALRHLCREGWTGKVAELRSELAAALKDHAPKADVKTTAAGLLKSVPAGAEVVSVTDGLGPE